MKKTVLALGFALTLFSCQKDEVLQQPHGHSTTASVAATSSAAITTENGYLVFPDDAMFESTIDDLRIAHTRWYEDFMSQFKDGTSRNVINDKLNDAHFNLFKELDYFEDSYGIVSLRSRINKDVDNWISNPGSGSNPDIHPVGSTFWRAVLNQFGEVKVGDYLHIHKDNGDYLVIRYYSLDDLSKLRAQDEYTTDFLADFKYEFFTPASSNASSCVEQGTGGKSYYSYDSSLDFSGITTATVDQVFGEIRVWSHWHNYPMSNVLTPNWIFRGRASFTAKTYELFTSTYSLTAHNLSVEITAADSKWSPNCNNNYSSFIETDTVYTTTNVSYDMDVYVENARYKTNLNHTNVSFECGVQNAFTGNEKTLETNY